MEIRTSKYLEKCLSNDSILKRDYGCLAPKIKASISVLVVADNLGEVPNVPPTRRHKLSGKYDGCWALDLNRNYRLIIRPTARTEDVSSIREVEIIDIVDYH